jgi:hypothetical protein
MRLKNIVKRIPFNHKTKIVDVLIAPPLHPDAKIGRCYSTAIRACQEIPGTTMVQGYLIQACDEFSLRPTADAMVLKHYWNKTRGQFIDYSLQYLRDSVYVLDQDHSVNYDFSDWLMEDDYRYYTLGEKLSEPTQAELARLNDVKAKLQDQGY